MTSAVEQLFSQAGALSPHERADLAYQLLSTLDDDDRTDETWERDIDERISEVQAETVAGHPMEELLALARNELRRTNEVTLRNS